MTDWRHWHWREIHWANSAITPKLEIPQSDQRPSLRRNQFTKPSTARATWLLCAAPRESDNAASCAALCNFVSLCDVTLNLLSSLYSCATSLCLLSSLCSCATSLNITIYCMFIYLASVWTLASCRLQYVLSSISYSSDIKRINLSTDQSIYTYTRTHRHTYSGWRQKSKRRKKDKERKKKRGKPGLWPNPDSWCTQKYWPGGRVGFSRITLYVRAGVTRHDLYIPYHSEEKLLLCCWICRETERNLHVYIYLIGFSTNMSPRLCVCV